MELAEAKAVNLEVSDEAVALAEKEAQEAAELAAELERQAVEHDTPPKTSAVVEQKALAEFAQRRAEHTRGLADQARAARRLLDLEQVGADVTKLAAAAAKPDTGLQAAVAKIAEGAAELRALAAAHDGQVRDLVARAKRLQVEPAAPAGPRATSAHVALLPRREGIQLGATLARLIGDRVGATVDLAVKGDTEGAVAYLAAARQQPEAVRAPHYFRTASGRVVTSGDPVPPAFAGQLAAGTLQELDDDGIERYLGGRLDGQLAP